MFFKCHSLTFFVACKTLSVCIFNHWLKWKFFLYLGWPCLNPLGPSWVRLARLSKLNLQAMRLQIQADTSFGSVHHWREDWCPTVPLGTFTWPAKHLSISHTQIKPQNCFKWPLQPKTSESGQRKGKPTCWAMTPPVSHCTEVGGGICTMDGHCSWMHWLYQGPALWVPTTSPSI